ncbi:MAG: hypothetical protein KDG50_13470 [Chromatiales bacterium]|nr:hypothetical protein [Chromatiales bacterium]
MIPYLYISASSYSGSTLLAFLLNTHPRIATISEAEGWSWNDGEDYRCSCGARVPDCVFFRELAAAFAVAKLPFDFRNFGTRFALSADGRRNRLLTGPLPGALGKVEPLRDALLWRLPGTSGELRRALAANRVLVDTALAHFGAQAFVDAAKSPHRLNHLARDPRLQLTAVHLVRDPRAFAASVRRKWGMPLEASVARWAREQAQIERVLRRFERRSVLHYETLCSQPQTAVDRLTDALGLERHTLPADFRGVEHHILGNAMRLGGAGDVRCDERWRDELDDQARERIDGAIMRSASRYRLPVELLPADAF